MTPMPLITAKGKQIRTDATVLCMQTKLRNSLTKQ